MYSKNMFRVTFLLSCPLVTKPTNLTTDLLIIDDGHISATEYEVGGCQAVEELKDEHRNMEINQIIEQRLYILPPNKNCNQGCR